MSYALVDFHTSVIIAPMAKQRWQHIESPETIFSISRAGDLGWVLGTNQGNWKLIGDRCVIMSETLRPATITAVAASPQFPMHTVILAGAADGIARSVDEGMTWNGAAMTQPAQIGQIVLSPSFQADGAAFAATMQDGVLCSTDQGVHWQSWNFGLLDLETVALAISPRFPLDETVVVATVRGIFRSVNAGRAWRELPAPEEALPFSSIAFAGAMLVAGSESEGLYYSQDGGMTWTKRSSFKSGQINAVAVSPNGKVIAVATPMVVATSSDEGVNWTRTEGHVPKGILSLAVTDEGEVLCGTQEDGLWRHGTEV
jgi:photosystem II stability/assembly factor-like uncharacterized protein